MYVQWQTMAVGQGGLMWALIFITIALRFSPKRLENFNGFNPKASDLGYYASYDLNYLQKCDFTLKTLFPVQNKKMTPWRTIDEDIKLQLVTPKITYYME